MYAETDEALQAEQARALKEFSAAVLSKYADAKERYPYPYANSTTTFNRFLKSRCFDVAKALKKYDDWRAWTQKEGVARYRTEEPPHNEKHNGLYPHCIAGVDKLGHPIYCERLGETHMPSLRKLTNVPDYARFHTWKNERVAMACEKASLARNKAIFKFTAIVDLNCLSLAHRHGMDFFGCGSEIDEQFYPETVFKVFVVNAPWVFPAIWNIAKNFIDPDTRTKIEFLNGGVEDFSKALLEHIDADQLPVEYGGTLQVNYPHSIHEQLEDGAEKKAEELETVELQVGSGKTHQITVPIRSDGHLLWYFTTQPHNIDFTCEVRSQNGTKTVVERQRLSLHEGTHEVTVAEGEESEAVFYFCNKFSYMRGKTVQHYISFEAKT